MVVASNMRRSEAQRAVACIPELRVRKTGWADNFLWMRAITSPKKTVRQESNCRDCRIPQMSSAQQAPESLKLRRRPIGMLSHARNS
jgi:hypothetical protein